MRREREDDRDAIAAAGATGAGELEVRRDADAGVALGAWQELEAVAAGDDQPEAIGDVRPRALRCRRSVVVAPDPAGGVDGPLPGHAGDVLEAEAERAADRPGSGATIQQQHRPVRERRRRQPAVARPIARDGSRGEEVVSALEREALRRPGRRAPDPRPDRAREHLVALKAATPRSDLAGRDREAGHRTREAAVPPRDHVERRIGHMRERGRCARGMRAPTRARTAETLRLRRVSSWAVEESNLQPWD